MIKRITIAALIFVAPVGCQKESVEAEKSSTTVSFSASGISSRVTQVEDVDGEMVYAWESDDEIGISTDGYSVGSWSADSYNYNLKFIASTATTSTSTSFEGADKSQYIENELSSGESCEVTFNAYYPYRSESTISIDISDQKSYFIPAAGDVTDYSKYENFVASTTATMAAGEALSVAFEFKNLLAKLVIELTFDSDVSDITSGSAVISGIHTTASYDQLGAQSTLDDLSSVDLAFTIDQELRTAQLTALLHPESLSTTSKIRFVIGGDVYNLNLYDIEDNTISERVLVGGTLYRYQATLSESTGISL